MKADEALSLLNLIITEACFLLSLQSDLKHTVDTELYNWCL